MNISDTFKTMHLQDGPYSDVHSLLDKKSDKRKASSADIKNRNQPELTLFDGNNYDTPGEVRSKSAPPDQDASFTGLNLYKTFIIIKRDLQDLIS